VHTIRWNCATSHYINLLITKEPLYLYFKPYPNSFKNNILRVSPDILPPGSIFIEECFVDGKPYKNYDPKALTVKLPGTKERVKVKVKISPTTWLESF
jgi:hypothetical protein